jgi:SAM-dependent methyltransferase
LRLDRPGEASGCCSSTAAVPAIGYTAEDLASAGVANLGLGCGNPQALSGIESGMTVLDLGCGAGFDAFLAWRRVGSQGRVIGVDMTDDMLALARRNAEQLGASNVDSARQHRAAPVETRCGRTSTTASSTSADKDSVFRAVFHVKPAAATP